MDDDTHRFTLIGWQARLLVKRLKEKMRPERDKAQRLAASDAVREERETAIGLENDRQGRGAWGADTPAGHGLSDAPKHAPKLKFANC